MTLRFDDRISNYAFSALRRQTVSSLADASPYLQCWRMFSSLCFQIATHDAGEAQEIGAEFGNCLPMTQVKVICVTWALVLLM